MNGKSLITILLLALVVYGGWWYYSGDSMEGVPPLEPTPTPVPTPPPSDGSVETVSVGPEIRKELEQMAEGLLSPLDEKSAVSDGDLKRLWNQSKEEYEAGRLSQADAAIYANVIRELQKMMTERQTALARYREVASRNKGGFGLGKKDERNRELILQQMKKAWMKRSGDHQGRIRDLLARNDGATSPR